MLLCYIRSVFLLSQITPPPSPLLGLSHPSILQAVECPRVSPQASFLLYIHPLWTLSFSLSLNTILTLMPPKCQSLSLKMLVSYLFTLHPHLYIVKVKVYNTGTERLRISTNFVPYHHKAFPLSINGTNIHSALSLWEALLP